MKKILIIYLTLLFTLCNVNNTSYSISKDKFLKNTLCINNVIDKDIKIEIKNIKTENHSISLDKIYEIYSIITMDVTNTGLDYVELSNINYSIYQGDKNLQTFIQTENKCLGFIGTLKSGETKEVKIGVVLEEKNIPLKLVFENLIDIRNGKNIKVINL